MAAYHELPQGACQQLHQFDRCLPVGTTDYRLHRFGPSELAQLQLSSDGRTITSTLGQTRVLFDGTPAPMLYAVSGQVSVIVPLTVAGRTSTRVQVEFQGRQSLAINVPVAAATPGVFTLKAMGSGQGAILNQDYSINSASNPAHKGSVVIIYGTGAGVTTPQGNDGQIVAGAPRLGSPVSVRMSGQEAELLYAGSAPGLVNGVFQINAKIPDGITGVVSVVVNVGGVQSQAGVSVAVE